MDADTGVAVGAEIDIPIAPAVNDGGIREDHLAAAVFAYSRYFHGKNPFSA
jgi:hypothetical protein